MPTLLKKLYNTPHIADPRACVSGIRSRTITPLEFLA
jgi:hypothetical protein